MFENQTNLQEKWGRLLDFDGLDPIRDSHRRNVTAQLLENQEKFLREERALSTGVLMEGPTMSANAPGGTGGFSGSATAAGPVAGFDPVLIAFFFISIRPLSHQKIQAYTHQHNTSYSPLNEPRQS